MKLPRIQNFPQKLAITLTYLAVVAAFRYFRLDCLFLTIFGIPCPGCGMTRALLAALRLDFPAAFSHHPMFWSAPLMYVYFLTDGRLLRRKGADGLVWAGLGAGFLVNWILKLFFAI